MNMYFKIPKRLRSFSIEEEELLNTYFSKAEIRRIKKEINSSPNTYDATCGNSIFIEKKINDIPVIVARIFYDSWQANQRGREWDYHIFPYGIPV